MNAPPTHVLSHLFESIAVGVVVLGFIVAVIRSLTHSPIIRVWTGGAWAAFVSGFIEGTPVGSPVGAGIAIGDNQVHADLGLRHIAIEVAHVLAVPFFTGLAEVRTFTKANPFPNPFKAPPTPDDAAIKQEPPK